MFPHQNRQPDDFLFTYFFVKPRIAWQGSSATLQRGPSSWKCRLRCNGPPTRLNSVTRLVVLVAEVPRPPKLLLQRQRFVTVFLGKKHPNLWQTEKHWLHKCGTTALFKRGVETKFAKKKSKTTWWFQPIWKICSSKWVHLPQGSGWK